MSKSLGERAREVTGKVRIERMLKEAVFDNLGIPYDLYRIDIHPLGDDENFRVNVWRYAYGRIHISDSFYLHLSEEAGLVSSPEISKKY